MNPETLQILLVAAIGFIGMVIAFLVSRKPAVSLKLAKPVQEKKSLADRIAEGLVGAKHLPTPTPTPEFAYAFRKSGKRGMFRVVGTNRRRVFLDEIGCTGGCVMSRRRSRVQFV